MLRRVVTGVSKDSSSFIFGTKQDVSVCMFLYHKIYNYGWRNKVSSISPHVSKKNACVPFRGQGTGKPVLLRLSWKWKQHAFPKHLLCFTNLHFVKTRWLNYYSWNEYIMYLKRLDKLREWVYHAKRRKKFISVQVCEHIGLLFEVQPPCSPEISLLHSLALGKLKNSAEFSPNWIWIDSSRTNS
jgi:hypothetical protein